MAENIPDEVTIENLRKRLASPQPAPSIGRIVHYQSYGTPGGEYLPEPRAAVVTAVHTETIDAAVFNPTGLFFAAGLPFADTPTPGHWNWPPRV